MGYSTNSRIYRIKTAVLQLEAPQTERGNIRIIRDDHGIYRCLSCEAKLGKRITPTQFIQHAESHA